MRMSQNPTWSSSAWSSQQALDVEGLARGVARDGGVEEEALADVDPPEELPVPPQLRLEHAVRGHRREALQALVEILRAEHGQHHALLVVRAVAADARLLAHQ